MEMTKSALPSDFGSFGSIVFSGGTLQYSSANTNDYSGRFSTAAGQTFSATQAHRACGAKHSLGQVAD